MTAPRFTPTTAVEMQDELARFYRSTMGERFMAGIVEARIRDGYLLAARDGTTRSLIEAQTMLGARTHFVTTEMLDLAEHAARSLPPCAISFGDLPCPMGFCVFERSFLMPDVHGKTLALTAFSWRVARGPGGGDGVLWTYYGDAQDPRDDYVRERVDGKQPPGTMGLWRETRLLYIGEDAEQFEVVEASAEEVTASLHARDIMSDPEDIAEARVFMRKVPLSLWALMTSEGIATTTTERAARATRRRLEKEQSPMTGDVVVVHLRRMHVEAAPSGDHAVEWQRRWIVSGHWRRAWRPSVKAHRMVWIAPFVKGPEDKPLVVTRKVHVLDR